MITLKKPGIQLIFFYSIIILFSSCAAPTGYCTLTQNVPLFKSQYEFHALGTMSFNHLEEQFSYSPFPNIGVIGNFYQRFDDEKSNTFEAGFGYYKLFKNDYEIEGYGIFTHSNNLAINFQENMTEAFSIAGWQSMDTIITNNLTANYSGASLQINLGKHFDGAKLALCLRYSLFDYSNYNDHRYIRYGERFDSDTTYNLNSKFQSFFTIAPTFEVGKGSIRYYGQLGFHFNPLYPTQSYYKTPLNFDQFLFTNALVLYLDFKKKK